LTRPGAWRGPEKSSEYLETDNHDKAEAAGRRDKAEAASVREVRDGVIHMRDTLEELSPVSLGTLLGREHRKQTRRRREATMHVMPSLGA
jgi:hypothetical protein